MVTGSRQAAVVLGEMEKQANRSSKAVDGLTSSADSAGRSMSGFKSVLSGVASAISVALIIDYGKAFLTVADNITQLQSRILRLSTDAATAMSTFETLTAIASTTGASLRDTAKLWEAMTSALKGTGATNTQILALTDTLQKIGRVGGSSTEEMANALRQFGQSISSGTVRAEEFNSILEQMPELARQIGAGMGLSMGQLRQAMLEGKLSAQDALNAIMKQSSAVNDEFSKLPRTMDQASNSLTISLQNLIGKMNEAMGASATMVKIIDSISAAIDRLSGKTETASQKIADLTSTGEMYARRARTWSWLGLDGWSEQNQALAALSNKAATLIGDMNSVAKASENAANGTINFNNSGTANPKQDALVKRSQRRIELSKLEGEAKARLQALYDAEDAGIPKNDPRVKTLQDQYAEIERNTKAQKESNAEGKKSASQAESVAQKLANLKQQSELAAGSTKEMSREQSILTAQQSLGKAATQEQIKLAGEYAAKIWDTANALKMKQQAEQAARFVDKEVAASKTAVNPSTGLAQDPTAEVNQEELQKLEALNNYQQLGVLSVQQYEDAKTAILQQAAYQRQEILDQEQRTYQQNISSLLGESSSFAGSIADAIGQAAGKSSAAYQALFAISKGFAIAQASLNLQTAISNAMAIPWPANIPAISQALSAGTQIVSAISGISYGGARYNGGPVSAGAMYQVGERGKPEIYQASTGKQYMIPGDNGKVISNKQMTGGGSAAPTIIIENYSSGAGVMDTQASKGADGGDVVRIVLADLQQGGQISQGISQYHQAPRKATE
ncbi:tape measure protein [Serratia marcescens]|uniref:tape measure protein n=1 Tax=Serratia marcescens TaxID=615 RepID=UPI003C6F9E36